LIVAAQCVIKDRHFGTSRRADAGNSVLVTALDRNSHRLGEEAIHPLQGEARPISNSGRGKPLVF